MKSPTDFQLAHALTRIGFGINIAMHGIARIPTFGEFSQHLEIQFAGTMLPAALVSASAYGIVLGECVIGVLMILGWRLRSVLVAGTFLMFALLFGICLVQNWSVAGSQLIYLVLYTGLIATLKYDWLSLDSLCERED